MFHDTDRYADIGLCSTTPEGNSSSSDEDGLRTLTVIWTDLVRRSARSLSLISYLGCLQENNPVLATMTIHGTALKYEDLPTGMRSYTHRGPVTIEYWEASAAPPQWMSLLTTLKIPRTQQTIKFRFTLFAFAFSQALENAVRDLEANAGSPSNWPLTLSMGVTFWVRSKLEAALQHLAGVRERQVYLRRQRQRLSSSRRSSSPPYRQSSSEFSQQATPSTPSRPSLASSSRRRGDHNV